MSLGDWLGSIAAVIAILAAGLRVDSAIRQQLQATKENTKAIRRLSARVDHMESRTWPVSHPSQSL